MLVFLLHQGEALARVLLIQDEVLARQGSFLHQGEALAPVLLIQDLRDEVLAR